ncbi:hypothetical protein BDY19DRAFT_904266 [Irpex rosettiformis]|uniref:Uncharacterized protein n=1 Tax=Irpex rosettiformis TaxID=378272 RepID=A0ACB8UBM1_9APHY|nr:hypothetical protein BDY19DRAFT_904266 [Irpex rosettiformis]
MPAYCTWKITTKFAHREVRKHCQCSSGLSFGSRARIRPVNDRNEFEVQTHGIRDSNTVYVSAPLLDIGPELILVSAVSSAKRQVMHDIVIEAFWYIAGVLHSSPFGCIPQSKKCRYQHQHHHRFYNSLRDANRNLDTDNGFQLHSHGNTLGASQMAEHLWKREARAIGREDKLEVLSVCRMLLADEVASFQAAFKLSYAHSQQKEARRTLFAVSSVIARDRSLAVTREAGAGLNDYCSSTKPSARAVKSYSHKNPAKILRILTPRAERNWKGTPKRQVERHRESNAHLITLITEAASLCPVLYGLQHERSSLQAPTECVIPTVYGALDSSIPCRVERTPNCIRPSDNHLFVSIPVNHLSDHTLFSRLFAPGRTDALSPRRKKQNKTTIEAQFRSRCLGFRLRSPLNYNAMDMWPRWDIQMSDELVKCTDSGTFLFILRVHKRSKSGHSAVFSLREPFPHFQATQTQCRARTNCLQNTANAISPQKSLRILVSFETSWALSLNSRSLKFTDSVVTVPQPLSHFLPNHPNPNASKNSYFAAFALVNGIAIVGSTNAKDNYPRDPSIDAHFKLQRLMRSEDIVRSPVTTYTSLRVVDEASRDQRE